MFKKKQVLAVVGIACVWAVSLSVVYVAASPAWDINNLISYMENVGRHKLWQTNWILYNEIDPKVDAIEEKLDKLDVEALGHELYADPGDTDNASIVVLVTFGGDGVTGLTAANFYISSVHGPGAIQIVDVLHLGGGKYVLYLQPYGAGTWLAGDYLSILTVIYGTKRGGSVVRLTVT